MFVCRRRQNSEGHQHSQPGRRASGAQRSHRGATGVACRGPSAQSEYREGAGARGQAAGGVRQHCHHHPTAALRLLQDHQLQVSSLSLSLYLLLT